MVSPLNSFSTPADVKSLDAAGLAELASDLRGEMIAATSINGGHLASSLGAVELILAAYRVLDLPHDRLLFDVGHQAYAHKMMTGRLDGFARLRQADGISGFTRRNESIYDVHDSGHASDALPTAVGLACARDYLGGDENIVSIVGDASIVGGLSLEALNYAGQAKLGRFVIVLNDNEMSISRSVGALSSYLAAIRTSKFYTSTRDQVEDNLAGTGAIGAGLVNWGERAKKATKKFLVPGMFFEEFGFTYLGPIDGHDVRVVEETLQRALDVPGPVVVHAVTKKGKGFGPAESHPEVFHGVGPFDPVTGSLVASGKKAPSYTDVFAHTLDDEASHDRRIVAITAAMMDGTGLAKFASKYPERTFDVGIAEECAVTMASGMAIGGLVPVVAIYSTFLQRAYDEISTNICIPAHHVVFAVDRGGLVGEDGSTHHGMFDLAYLRTLPNMRILAPSDGEDLRRALSCALAMDGPVAVRYPRGSVCNDLAELGTAGDGSLLPANLPARVVYRSVADTDSVDVCLLAVGKMASISCRAATILSERGVSVEVVDARWVKPVDVAAVQRACGSRLVVTVEDGTICGGFGSAVLETISDLGLCAPVLRLGLPDGYVGHGSVDELLASLRLDAHGIAGSVLERLGTLGDRA